MKRIIEVNGTNICTHLHTFANFFSFFICLWTNFRFSLNLLMVLHNNVIALFLPYHCFRPTRQNIYEFGDIFLSQIDTNIVYIWSPYTGNIQLFLIKMVKVFFLCCISLFAICLIAQQRKWIKSYTYIYIYYGRLIFVRYRHICIYIYISYRYVILDVVDQCVAVIAYNFQLCIFHLSLSQFYTVHSEIASLCIFNFDIFGHLRKLIPQKWIA